MHFVLMGPVPEAIDELADLGHTLTVLSTERNRTALAGRRHRIAHSGVVPSYDRPELAWSVIAHLGLEQKIDGVIAAHEMAVVGAAMLNQLLGLPQRTDPRTAMAGRDKAIQKSLWHRHGVPTSRFATFTDVPADAAEARDLLADLPAPYVVKPPAEGGTTSVFACADADEVFALVDGNPDLRHAVVEERQPGREWHFDGAIVDGTIEHLMVSRYLAPLIETKNGATLRSVAYPVHAHPALYAESLAFSQAAVDALGGRWGVFHLEVFGEPGGFVAGELAWRPAGVLAPLSAQHTIGLNLWAAHARLMAGEPLTPREPDRGAVFGFVCLPVKPGATNGVTRADLEALPGVRHVKMKVDPGKVMGSMTASTISVGMALIEAPTIERCEQLIDDAVERTRLLHEQKSRVATVAT
ncbi:hypothetical protein [Lentzea sp.]|uniref:hypothetical protein n=1 Tax=Lentzea sp. TaxID=56099 RepID=UPI002ED457B7